MRLESLNHHAAAFHDLAIADVQLQEEEWDQLNFLFHRPDVDVTKTKSQMNRETVSFGPIVYNALSSSDSAFWGSGLENERGWVVMGFTRVFQFFPFVMFRWMDVFDSTNRSAKCYFTGGLEGLLPISMLQFGQVLCGVVFIKMRLLKLLVAHAFVLLVQKSMVSSRSWLIDTFNQACLTLYILQHPCQKIQHDATQIWQNQVFSRPSSPCWDPMWLTFFWGKKSSRHSLEEEDVAVRGWHSRAHQEIHLHFESSDWKIVPTGAMGWIFPRCRCCVDFPDFFPRTIATQEERFLNMMFVLQVPHVLSILVFCCQNPISPSTEWKNI